jgi:hypothetical protein
VQCHSYLPGVLAADAILSIFPFPYMFPSIFPHTPAALGAWWWWWLLVMVVWCCLVQVQVIRTVPYRGQQRRGCVQVDRVG